jgi:hypothetical protein
MEEEDAALISNDTWDLVTRLREANAITSK